MTSTCNIVAFDASQADQNFGKEAEEKYSKVHKLSLSDGGIIIAARNILDACVPAIYNTIAIYCNII